MKKRVKQNAIIRLVLGVLVALNVGYAVIQKAPTMQDGLNFYEKRRFKDALKVFQTLCARQNARACFSLGFMYEAGQGAKKSDGKASKYYDKACKSKVAAACFNLGLLYERNKRGKNAEFAFVQACSLKHKESCKRLAVGFEKQGQNDLAVAMYDKSCDLKDARACFKLAKLYEDGNVTRQDTKTALFHYSNSCNLGFGEACFVLGEHHESKDKPLAKRYYGKACDENYSPACNAYKRLNEAEIQ